MRNSITFKLDNLNLDRYPEVNFAGISLIQKEDNLIYSQSSQNLLAVSMLTKTIYLDFVLLSQSNNLNLFLEIQLFYNKESKRRTFFSEIFRFDERQELLVEKLIVASFQLYQQTVVKFANVTLGVLVPNIKLPQNGDFFDRSQLRFKVGDDDYYAVFESKKKYQQNGQNYFQFSQSFSLPEQKVYEVSIINYSAAFLKNWPQFIGKFSINTREFFADVFQPLKISTLFFHYLQFLLSDNIDQRVRALQDNMRRFPFIFMSFFGIHDNFVEVRPQDSICQIKLEQLITEQLTAFLPNYGEFDLIDPIVIQHNIKNIFKIISPEHQSTPNLAIFGVQQHCYSNLSEQIQNLLINAAFYSFEGFKYLLISSDDYEISSSLFFLSSRLQNLRNVGILFNDAGTMQFGFLSKKIDVYDFRTNSIRYVSDNTILINLYGQQIGQSLVFTREKEIIQMLSTFLPIINYKHHTTLLAILMKIQHLEQLFSQMLENLEHWDTKTLFNFDDVDLSKIVVDRMQKSPQEFIKIIEFLFVMRDKNQHLDSQGDDGLLNTKVLQLSTANLPKIDGISESQKKIVNDSSFSSAFIKKHDMVQTAQSFLLDNQSLQVIEEQDEDNEIGDLQLNQTQVIRVVHMLIKLGFDFPQSQHFSDSISVQHYLIKNYELSKIVAVVYNLLDESHVLMNKYYDQFIPRIMRKIEHQSKLMNIHFDDQNIVNASNFLVFILSLMEEEQKQLFRRVFFDFSKEATKFILLLFRLRLQEGTTVPKGKFLEQVVFDNVSDNYIYTMLQNMKKPKFIYDKYKVDNLQEGFQEFILSLKQPLLIEEVSQLKQDNLDSHQQFSLACIYQNVIFVKQQFNQSIFFYVPTSPQEEILRSFSFFDSKIEDKVSTIEDLLVCIKEAGWSTKDIFEMNRQMLDKYFIRFHFKQYLSYPKIFFENILNNNQFDAHKQFWQKLTEVINNNCQENSLTAYFWVLMMEIDFILQRQTLSVQQQVFDAMDYDFHNKVLSLMKIPLDTNYIQIIENQQNNYIEQHCQAAVKVLLNQKIYFTYQISRVFTFQMDPKQILQHYSCQNQVIYAFLDTPTYELSTLSAIIDCLQLHADNTSKLLQMKFNSSQQKFLVEICNEIFGSSFKDYFVMSESFLVDNLVFQQILEHIFSNNITAVVKAVQQHQLDSKLAECNNLENSAKLAEYKWIQLFYALLLQSSVAFDFKKIQPLELDQLLMLYQIYIKVRKNPIKQETLISQVSNLYNSLSYEQIQTLLRNICSETTFSVPNFEIVINHPKCDLLQLLCLNISGIFSKLKRISMPISVRNFSSFAVVFNKFAQLPVKIDRYDYGLQEIHQFLKRSGVYYCQLYRFLNQLFNKEFLETELKLDNHDPYNRQIIGFDDLIYQLIRRCNELVLFMKIRDSGFRFQFKTKEHFALILRVLQECQPELKHVSNTKDIISVLSQIEVPQDCNDALSLFGYLDIDEFYSMQELELLGFYLKNHDQIHLQPEQEAFVKLFFVVLASKQLEYDNLVPWLNFTDEECAIIRDKLIKLELIQPTTKFFRLERLLSMVNCKAAQQIVKQFVNKEQDCKLKQVYRLPPQPIPFLRQQIAHYKDNWTQLNQIVNRFQVQPPTDSWSILFLFLIIVELGQFEAGAAGQLPGIRIS